VIRGFAHRLCQGLYEPRVILVHGSNALIPVLTIIGPLSAAVGTGSFFVETIYWVPGLGGFLSRV
jgi:ABC-type dipeptide/oligopeptide/nickel transport system permease component